MCFFRDKIKLLLATEQSQGKAQSSPVEYLPGTQKGPRFNPRVAPPVIALAEGDVKDHNGRMRPAANLD